MTAVPLEEAGARLAEIVDQLRPGEEVVLVRAKGSSDAPLLDTLRTRFVPSQVLVRHEEGAAAATPLAADRPAQGGKPTAYVCVRGSFKLPVTEPAELDKLL